MAGLIYRLRPLQIADGQAVSLLSHLWTITEATLGKSIERINPSVLALLQPGPGVCFGVGMG